MTKFCAWIWILYVTIGKLVRDEPGTTMDDVYGIGMACFFMLLHVADVIKEKR